MQKVLCAALLTAVVYKVFEGRLAVARLFRSRVVVSNMECYYNNQAKMNNADQGNCISIEQLQADRHRDTLWHFLVKLS